MAAHSVGLAFTFCAEQKDDRRGEGVQGRSPRSASGTELSFLKGGAQVRWPSLSRH